MGWVDHDIQFIRERYNRISGYYRIFEWIYWLPRGIRQRAIDRLDLKPGARVLEIGCGTGRNLAYLRAAVGDSGQVFGVDLSEGMLATARALCTARQWVNVELANRDFLEYSPGEQVDCVLFSLSYATMPNHKQILAKAWDLMKPGGRIVILDAKLPDGFSGRVMLPATLWMMKHSVLGNPYIRPWEELASLTSDIAMEEVQFGTYYICRGTKP